MTLEPKDKLALSDIRMSKAREFYKDAKANYDGGRYMTSINRSYYSVLHAARALLILEGVNPESHEGTVTMLSIRFIKTHILPVDVIKKFKKLLSRRTDVDYGDLETIDANDAEDSLKIAEEIIDVIDKVRKALHEQMKE